MIPLWAHRRSLLPVLQCQHHLYYFRGHDISNVSKQLPYSNSTELPTSRVIFIIIDEMKVPIRFGIVKDRPRAAVTGTVLSLRSLRSTYKKMPCCDALGNIWAAQRPPPCRWRSWSRDDWTMKMKNIQTSFTAPSGP
jgi:hypothetical protein